MKLAQEERYGIPHTGFQTSTVIYTSIFGDTNHFVTSLIQPRFFERVGP